jgi:hypothetical protein
MTVSEASSVLGSSLKKTNEESEGCYFVKAEVGPKGLSFMVVNNKIVRVDVYEGQLATENGARISDSEERIKSLYSDQFKVDDHAYTDKGHYIQIRRGNYMIVFETDGKQVTSYRAGKIPEVQYIEGCS